VSADRFELKFIGSIGNVVSIFMPRYSAIAQRKKERKKEIA